MTRRVVPTATKLSRRACLALCAASLAGCATFPPDLVASCAPFAPPIAVDPEREEASLLLSVLSYNVEGLPWPLRKNRAPRLREIARQLAEMRRQGDAPDIVLLQEVFSSTSGEIGGRAGYSNRVRGPGRGSSRPPTTQDADPSLVKGRRIFKGERLGRLFSSGLYVLSDYPVVESSGQPFRSRECAGFDCLANKGLQHVRLVIPGVPEPVDIFNTHLNSRLASGASEARSLAAHQLQIDEVSRFVAEQGGTGYAMIFGGDFNMKHSDDRFAHFERTFPYPLVHRFCLEEEAGCEVAVSWDGDTPWMDTQDLQGFDDGRIVKVRPVRVAAMFDSPWNGRRLADHDGLLVVYRLSWPLSAAARRPDIPPCPAG